MIYYEPFSNFKAIAQKSCIKDRADGGKFTVVVIETPTGERYKGTAIIKSEDMSHYRPLTGYKIAENRAYINYLKDRIKTLKASKALLTKTQSDKLISVYSNKEQRDIKHKIIELSKEINAGKKAIVNAYKLMDSIIEERWKVIDKIDQRAEKNKKRQELVDAIRAGQNS